MGKIIGVHGLAGGLKVYSYAESAQWATSGRSVSLIDDAGQLRRHRVISSQPYKKILRVTLSEVGTREQADALVGCGVFIERADLPELEDGTYYWVDLLGMEAVTAQGRRLGLVREIIATGANDVYVIRPEGGAEAEEILVPAVPSVVIEIDLANRRMIIEPPEEAE
jgi:16S rRNA processing protein RimM